jgi:hypothetical protein
MNCIAIDEYSLVMAAAGTHALMVMTERQIAAVSCSNRTAVTLKIRSPIVICLVLGTTSPVVGEERGRRPDSIDVCYGAA